MGISEEPATGGVTGTSNDNEFYDSLGHENSASEAMNNAQLPTGIVSHIDIDIENEGM